MFVVCCLFLIQFNSLLFAFKNVICERERECVCVWVCAFFFILSMKILSQVVSVVIYQINLYFSQSKCKLNKEMKAFLLFWWKNEHFLLFLLFVERFDKKIPIKQFSFSFFKIILKVSSLFLLLDFFVFNFGFLFCSYTFLFKAN